MIAPEEQNREPFIVAQLGARMHYAIPRILYARGLLEHCFLDICGSVGWPKLCRYVPKHMRPVGLQRLLGRELSGIPRDRLTSFSSFGWRYARRLRRARSRTQITYTHLWAGQTFGQLIARSSWPSARGVYTFNDAGLEVMAVARRRGIKTCLEQTIAPRETQFALLEAEHDAFPDWQECIAADSFRNQMIDRQHAEWELADIILCGSRFVAESIRQCGGPSQRCVVVPYGVDSDHSLRNHFDHHTKLRVLTVGTVGLRKGSPYVLRAARELVGVADFRMVGTVDLSSATRKQLTENVELTGPVPRERIEEHYNWADVFLLPSICEGSATVIYEALAHGLPVVCTENTGSVVRDGLDGFVIANRDSEAIVDRLVRLADDSDLVGQMSINASSRAGEYSLRHYGKRLVKAIL